MKENPPLKNQKLHHKYLESSTERKESPKSWEEKRALNIDRLVLKNWGKAVSTAGK